MFMIPRLTLFLIGPALADEVAFLQIQMEVKNRSERPIACSAQLAHWFSVELGAAAPQASISVALVYDPASGTVFIPNDSGDRMPIEIAWCGFEGSAWETRSQLDLAKATEAAIAC